MKQFLSVVFAFLLVSSAQAERFVPQGFCVVVLASRPTMDTALEEVRARWSDRDVTISRAKNGWYALTSRVIPQSNSAAVLASEKAAGRIPQDAICSSGQSYAQRVSRMPAASTRRVDIWSAANVSAMSRNDKQFFQLGLAFQGHYGGLLDGDWGRLSQDALEGYSQSTFSTTPQNWQLAMLAFDTFSLIERDGWAIFYNEWLRMSYLFPFDASREGNKSDLFLNYEHILGGPNVTRGSVSSMKGMAGDAMNMQITAPVQPGNSGGPVMDQFGGVVGVVVSKLDAGRMADIAGDIPQNINFAIRGEITELYLSKTGLRLQNKSKRQNLTRLLLLKPHQNSPF